ncbi:hypothetical protein AHAS_Ahas13G0359600 [Arachis hypogaea]
MASRRKGHMLQLDNQRLQVLAEVMFSILQLENQRLQRFGTFRGYAAGMPYLTCESDCVGCGSKPINELITCIRDRHASCCICVLCLGVLKCFSLLV